MATDLHTEGFRCKRSTSVYGLTHPAPVTVTLATVQTPRETRSKTTSKYLPRDVQLDPRGQPLKCGSLLWTLRQVKPIDGILCPGSEPVLHTLHCRFSQRNINSGQTPGLWRPEDPAPAAAWHGEVMCPQSSLVSRSELFQVSRYDSGLTEPVRRWRQETVGLIKRDSSLPPIVTLTGRLPVHIPRLIK